MNKCFDRFSTVVLQGNSGCTQKAPQHLGEHIEGQVEPGMPAQEAETQSHSRVQVGTLEQEYMLFITVTC